MAIAPGQHRTARELLTMPPQVTEPDDHKSAQPGEPRRYPPPCPRRGGRMHITEAFAHGSRRCFAARRIVGQRPSNNEQVLLALEIELLEIVYEGGNPIGLRGDGVDNVRLQLLGV
jgi:hypothetical protein